MPVFNDEIVTATIRQTFAVAGQEAYNVYTFKAFTESSDGDVLEGLGDFFETLHGTLAARLKSTFTWAEMIVRVPARQWLVGSVLLGLSGSATGEYLPQGVAALVQAMTPNYRRRGRKYLAGLTEGATDSAGRWNSAMLTAMANFGALYANPAHPDFSSMLTAGIYDRVTDQFLPFTGESRESEFAAYQRRRRPG